MSDAISRLLAENVLLGLNPLADKHECIKALRGLATLDVATVVRARWTAGTVRIGCWIKCSSCGIEQTERDAYGYKHSFNFCPNCGARMDGDADE
jgi:hypothetical protein